MMNLTFKNKKKIDSYFGGFLLVLLKPFVVLLGRILKRNHTITQPNEILFIKLLGGGSLVIFLPNLLGLKKDFPNLRLKLITTKNIEPFARSLCVFDDIYILDDDSIYRFCFKFLLILFKIFRIDTVVDLEVHSKISTLMSLLTAARNRVGFFKEDSFWLKGIYTHLVFFNSFSGVYEFYDAINRLFGSTPATIDDVGVHLQNSLNFKSPTYHPTYQPMFESQAISQSGLCNSLCNSLCNNDYSHNYFQHNVIIGFACSDNGKERMLSPVQWANFIFHQNIADKKVILLGGKNDFEFAKLIQNECAKLNIKVENYSGLLKLNESIEMIFYADRFFGIDSALIHFARLFKIPSISFWGPTDPMTRLRPISGYVEDVRYKKIACSPCIHYAESAPCCGQNLCMKNLFESESLRSATWLLSPTATTYLEMSML